MSVLLVPFYVQGAAIHCNVACTAFTVGQCGSYGCGASASAACHRYPAATLPYPCAYGAVSHKLCKLNVATLREGCVALHDGAVSGNVERMDVVDKAHEVRIAHRHERATEGAEVGSESVACLLVILLLVVKNGLQHVYRDAFHLIYIMAFVGKMQIERLHTRQRLQSYGGFTGEPFLIQILANASRRVAAHHGFRSVGIENAHREIGFYSFIGLAYQHKSVAAYASMVFAPCYCSFRRVGNGVFLCVYIYIVIASPVHLCELNRLYHFVYLFTLKNYSLSFAFAKLQQFAQ